MQYSNFDSGDLTDKVFSVMIVEDDFRVAALHRAAVERVHGFAVVAEARSGAEALDKVLHTKLDLVLLDLYLPDMSGLEVLAMLKSEAKYSLDVIVVTAARDVGSVSEAVRRGALFYLVKPFRYGELADRLQAYAAMRRKLGSLGELSQMEVDEIFSALRQKGDRVLPKGHSPQTLGVIVETLKTASEGLSADDVACRAGLSRATAQRYLAYLAHIGRITLVLKYGAGRPEHRYLWPGS